MARILNSAFVSSLVLVLVLFLTVGLSLFISVSPVYALPTCSGLSCDGVNPAGSDCFDVNTIAEKTVGGIKIEMRKSNDCNTLWTKVERTNDDYSGQLIGTIERGPSTVPTAPPPLNHGSFFDSHSEAGTKRMWTDMAWQGFSRYARSCGQSPQSGGMRCVSAFF